MIRATLFYFPDFCNFYNNMATNDLINNTILFPERQITQQPDQFGLQYQDFFVNIAAGNRLHGWYIPAGQPDQSRPVVMISHGNAGNVGYFLPWAKLLVELGYDAVLYDYQGYGKSDGKADVAALIGDAEAVLQWLRQRWPDKPLGLMGLSLGTLVSIALAVDGEAQDGSVVKSVVLEGSLVPSSLLADKFGVLGAAIAWAVSSQIPKQLHSDKQIAQVKCPTLFVHSADDQVTSLAGALKLYQLAVCEKEFWQVTNSDHLEIISKQQKEYLNRAGQFLKRHMPTCPATEPLP